MRGKIPTGLATVLALALYGCGGGSSPTAPSIPAPTPTPPVTDLRDGTTGAPVSGTITPYGGGRVTVTAPGFLTRDQTAVNPVWLWPQSEEYVRAIVYSFGTIDGNQPSAAMIRWAPGSAIRLALGPALANDSAAQTRLEACAVELARWSRLSVTVGSSGTVTLDVAPDLVSTGALATTHYQLAGWNITGAQVSFVDRNTAVAGQRGNTMLHELGHVLGLSGHSPIVTDVMSALRNRNDSLHFGGDEAAALTRNWFR